MATLKLRTFGGDNIPVVSFSEKPLTKMFLISNSLSGVCYDLCCVVSGSSVPRSRSLHVTRNRYSTWNRKKTTPLAIIRNRSTSDIGVLGYIGVL